MSIRVKTCVPASALVRGALVCMFVVASVMHTVGQSISLFDVSVGQPLISAKFYAKDATGAQVSPTASELILTENGIVRQITSVVCPTKNTIRPISAVLTIDVSGTMGQGTPSGLDIAKVAAHAWISGMPPSDGECAITSYARFNTLNQNFTSNKAALNAVIDGLTISQGTDYDMALITPPNGALEISKRGQYKRVIVLLTDGANNMPQRSSEIIAEAKTQACAIYIVCVGSQCPDALRNIAVQTGGSWYEYVRTAEESKAIYQGILGEVQLPEPCTITWEGLPCTNAERLVELSYKSAKDSARYAIPSTSYVDFNPSGMFIVAKPLGVPFDTTFTLTTAYGGVNILSITSNNPEYKIKTEAVVMDKDRTRKYTITFTPTDTLHSWAQFTFHTDYCDYHYYAHAGYPISAATSAIRIDYPNGGESLAVGTQADITWHGVADTTDVKLDYSTDDGLSWLPVVDTANSLSYAWNVPNTPSTHCLMRVIKHVDGAVSDSNLAHTLAGHWGRLYGYWSPDGLRYATKDQTVVRIWNPYTGELLHSMPTNVGPERRIEWSSDGVRIATGSQDGRVSSWNSFTGLLEHDFHTPVQVRGYNPVWSPNGRYLMTSGHDSISGQSDIAHVWDATTGMLLQDLSGHTQNLTDIVWSPDGTRAVTISQDGTGIVWDPINGIQLAPRLIGHTDFIGLVAWSPDGRVIATSSDDKTVRIWDATTHLELKALNGIESNRRALRFNSDGSRLLYAGMSTVRIWDTSTWTEVQALPLTFTLSDATWSHDGRMIAVASQSRAKVSVWNAFSGVMMHEYGGSNDQFVNVAFSPNDQFIAAAGDSGDAKIWSVGTIKNIDTSDALFAIVRPMPTGFDVDMKRVLVGGSKDSVVHSFITNNAAMTCVIDSIRLSGSDAPEFAVVNALDGMALSARSTADVTFRFVPASNGPKSALINVYTSLGIITQSIVGVGYTPQLGKVILRVGTGSARPGNVVSIPITIESDSNLVNTDAFGFSGQLRFNATLLEPFTTLTLKPIVNDERLVDVIMTSTPDKNGLLMNMQFRAALGNDSVCAITLENVEVLGGNVSVTTIPGSFKLDGICYAGGARLMNPNGAVTLGNPTPNPIVNNYTDVTVETIESGWTSLVLHDLVGGTVKAFITGELPSGVQTYTLDFDGVAAGAYMLVLRTPTEQRSVRIEVVP